MEKKNLKILWILTFLLWVIALTLPLVLSLDSNLPIACGGNSQIIVACLGNDELSFLGSIVPTIAGGQLGGGIEPTAEVEPEVVYIPKEAEYPFFSITNLNRFLKSKGLNQLDIYILEIFVFGLFICMLFLVFKKRKEKEKIETNK